VIWFTCSVLFFFSSRRRHTSFSRDWSSDVCSSDLGAGFTGQRQCSGATRRRQASSARPAEEEHDFVGGCLGNSPPRLPGDRRGEIGRASCRERGWVTVVAGA